MPIANIKLGLDYQKNALNKIATSIRSDWELIGMQYKTIIRTVAVIGIFFNPAIVSAETSSKAVDSTFFNSSKPIQLAAVEEQKVAKRVTNSYYVERKSYGTGRETEPPRYVRQLNKTWLKKDDALADIDWLDIGLDYRMRYEWRDNDFRRGRDTIDEPIFCAHGVL